MATVTAQELTQSWPGSFYPKYPSPPKFRRGAGDEWNSTNPAHAKTKMKNDQPERSVANASDSDGDYDIWVVMGHQRPRKLAQPGS
ncbi:hypothetical protein AUP68_03256 [Ilyonectria robusta]